MMCINMPRKVNPYFELTSFSDIVINVVLIAINTPLQFIVFLVIFAYLGIISQLDFLFVKLA